ncbi:MAG: NAD(P)H-dependent oxidoreductase subunit E [Rhodoblastus sp.]
MAHRAWSVDIAREKIARLAGLDGAALPILHALQEEFGYIDAAAIPMIASALNLSRAEIHGVVTFYPDFRARPAGRRVVKICRAEACQANGVEALLDELRASSGLAPDGGGGGGDGLAFETVYCLGNCALGPNALVDGQLVARLDAARLAEACRGGDIEAAQSAAAEAQ